MIDVHIQHFQAQTELLDAQGARSSLDDVIAQLAAWMGLASSRLTEDDMTVPTALGGSPYREGLRRRSLEWQSRSFTSKWLPLSASNSQ